VHIDDEVTTAEVLTEENIAALTQNENLDDAQEDDEDENGEETSSAPLPNSLWSSCRAKYPSHFLFDAW